MSVRGMRRTLGGGTVVTPPPGGMPAHDKFTHGGVMVVAVALERVRSHPAEGASGTPRPVAAQGTSAPLLKAHRSQPREMGSTGPTGSVERSGGAMSDAPLEGWRRLRGPCRTPLVSSSIKSSSVQGDARRDATFAAPLEDAFKSVPTSSPRTPGRTADERLNTETAQRTSTPPSSTARDRVVATEGEEVRDGVGVAVSVSVGVGVEDGVSVAEGVGDEESDVLGVGEDVRVADANADVEEEGEPVEERDVRAVAEKDAIEVDVSVPFEERVKSADAEEHALVEPVTEDVRLSIMRDAIGVTDDVDDVDVERLMLALIELERVAEEEGEAAAEEVDETDAETLPVTALEADIDAEPVRVEIDDAVLDPAPLPLEEREAVVVREPSDEGDVDSFEVTVAADDCVVDGLPLLTLVDVVDTDGERDAEEERVLLEVRLGCSDADTERVGVNDDEAEAVIDAEPVLLSETRDDAVALLDKDTRDEMLLVSDLRDEALTVVNALLSVGDADVELTAV